MFRTPKCWLFLFNQGTAGVSSFQRVNRDSHAISLIGWLIVLANDDSANRRSGSIVVD
jgi:hypothetical protein